MEKMLDKKSRDFAKNMRDTMIYDKSKNEVQIGTNLYVDGEGKFSAIDTNEVYINATLENYGSALFSNGFTAEADCTSTGFLQTPVLKTLPTFIAVNSLPLINNSRTLDVTDKNDVTLIDFETYGANKLRINSGNASIILDQHFDETQIDSMQTTPGTEGNYITLKTTFSGLKLAVIPLHGAVYITYEFAI